MVGRVAQAFFQPHHTQGAPSFVESAFLFFALGAKGGSSTMSTSWLYSSYQVNRGQTGLAHLHTRKNKAENRLEPGHSHNRDNAATRSGVGNRPAPIVNAAH